MIFNQWLKDKANELEITRMDFAKKTGITYRNLQTRNKGNPQLSNLIILCEVINSIQKGDKSSFDALIIEAIGSCSQKYLEAVKRIEEGK
jgi:predicted transcriptional regulator